MDKLILGLLLLKKLTVYEIRALIQLNFQPMCSDSLGSIQAAIKKLLDADMVTFSEYVEKSVNKKRYSITDKGRKAFMAWLHVPPNISGAKNMELGKLLFMGMLDSEEIYSLIGDIIVQLESDLNAMLAVKAAISDEGKQQVFAYWNRDLEYFGEVAKKAGAIDEFQELTLQYGIDLARFNVEWFKQLQKNKEATS